MQYFIWSTDNIGILATEALLRAAERGVKVRVIVDDLLIDAPDKSLLALDKHPNIEIRIYNPKHQGAMDRPVDFMNRARWFVLRNNLAIRQTTVTEPTYANCHFDCR